jgi:hypothetical protein
MAQLKITEVECRLLIEAYDGNAKTSLYHAMDEIAKVVGRINNVHTAFAFYDPATGKRIRRYGPFGDATPALIRTSDEVLGEEVEDIPA